MDDYRKLQLVQENYSKVLEIEDQILEFESLSERSTVTLHGVHSPGNAKNWREDAIVRLADKREELAEAVSVYVDSLQAAHEVLDGVKHPKHYEVLFKRYIQGYPWKRIAAEMGCSQRNCMLLHEKAIHTIF